MDSPPEEDVYAGSRVRKPLQGNGPKLFEASLDGGEVDCPGPAAFKGRALAMERIQATRFRPESGRNSNDRARRGSPGDGPQQSRTRRISIRHAHFIGGDP